MQIATKEFLRELDTLAATRRAEIRATKDEVTFSGTAYYVAADGCDEADGLSPATAWQSLDRVSNAALQPGDAVRFRRGDLFRGAVLCKAGVTYCAYGEGEKPRFYPHGRDLADPSLWELYNEKACIWRLKEKIPETGNLVFNGGAEHGYKHIPTYTKDGTFVCRDEMDRPFIVERELTNDLDFYHYYAGNLYTILTKGEDFPLPQMYNVDTSGDLYLRSNRGNPGYVFDSIEACTHLFGFRLGGRDNVTIDNLCIMYYGCHGITGGGTCTRGLHVTNCEIGWIGGVVQSYIGCDPNHPEGIHGEVTRFGNGVEIYGGCDDYVIDNCYVYECYDAGVSHQVTTKGKLFEMTSVLYKNNLIENCVYGIEYFLDMTDGDTESYMDGIEMCGNLIRHSGEGWGQQRHNTHTPAAIKGWSYVNRARNYTVHNNVYDRAGRRMIHLVADEQASCPAMWENTYVQYDGACLGQHGGKEHGEPPTYPFTDDAERVITEVFGERDPKVYIIKY